MERSHGGAAAAGGGMGRDSASSAQSKCAGGVEMAHLGWSWGDLGQMGSEEGMGGEQGSSVGVDGVISDMAGGWDMGGGETAHFLGVWGRAWGCSSSSGSVSRHS
jgi:hypothetical protein